MGFGDGEETVRRSAAGSENVWFHESVQPSQLLNYTSQADIGLVLTADNCLSHALSAPNKPFQYLAAGLRIVVRDLPELRKLVELTAQGVVLRDGSAETLLDACIEALALPPSNELGIPTWDVYEQLITCRYSEVLSGLSQRCEISANSYWG